jgi:hypothetical protein
VKNAEPALPRPLERLLGELGETLRPCRDPWWVIGSAAMALHGAEGLEVHDIDLLLSRRDARERLEERGLSALPGTEDERFHSDIFGTWYEGAYRVEMFGAFKVRDGAGWVEISPASRVEVRAGTSSLYVPSVEELIRLGRLFGRAKDAAREPLLLALLAKGGTSG